MGTKLGAGRPRFDFCQGRGFFSSPPLCPDRLCGPPSLLSNVHRGLFPRGYSGRGIKLTTHLHLAPRLIMRGAVPLLPHVFMAWYLVKHKESFYASKPTGTSLRVWLCNTRGQGMRRRQIDVVRTSPVVHNKAAVDWVQPGVVLLPASGESLYYPFRKYILFQGDPYSCRERSHVSTHSGQSSGWHPPIRSGWCSCKTTDSILKVFDPNVDLFIGYPYWDDSLVFSNLFKQIAG
jgi:hypothetical protein